MSTSTSDNKRLLIINADDFGLSPAVNAGIIQAHRAGVVTSASLLTTGEGFADAIVQIKANPHLDIGIHLNMFRGRPLTAPTHLIGPSGEFVNQTVQFLCKCLANRQRATEEITKEFSAQIEKGIAHGLQPSHLDTEKHLHCLPFLFAIVLRLAEKYQIPAIRFPCEPISLRSLFNPSQFLKLGVMGLFAKTDRRLLQKSRRKAPDFFWGVSLSKRFSFSNLQQLLLRLPAGISELSCHPGLTDGKNSSYMDKFRAQELGVLTDPRLKNILAANGVELTCFKNL